MQTFSLGLFDGGYAGGIDLSLEEVLFLALFSDVLQPVFGGIVSVVFSDDGNSVRIYFLHFVLAVFRTGFQVCRQISLCFGHIFQIVIIDKGCVVEQFVFLPVVFFVLRQKGIRLVGLLKCHLVAVRKPHI